MPKTENIGVKVNNSTLITALVANDKATSLSLHNTTDEIKQYFIAVLNLSKSNNEFPVNLDEVYPIVYTQKGHAFRELKTNFIEGVDYYLSQNGKVVNSNDLTNGIKYECFLSLPCLEFFIARKVRPVFDVYREVFHKTAEIIPKVAKSSAADKRKITQLEKELERTKEQLKWERWSGKQETELKCSCFHYLVETKQYAKWEEYRRNKNSFQK